MIYLFLPQQVIHWIHPNAVSMTHTNHRLHESWLYSIESCYTQSTSIHPHCPCQCDNIFGPRARVWSTETAISLSNCNTATSKHSGCVAVMNVQKNMSPIKIPLAAQPLATQRAVCTLHWWVKADPDAHCFPQVELARHNAGCTNLLGFISLDDIKKTLKKTVQGKFAQYGNFELVAANFSEIVL